LLPRAIRGTGEPMRGLPLLIFILCSCASVDDGTLDQETVTQDAQAETVTSSGGKADGASSYVGLYTTHVATHVAGDLTSLQLLAPTSGGPTTRYVRERCYHPGCALPLPETDTYDLHASASGKTYVRFYSFVAARDAHGNLTSTPKITDVYEIAKTSVGIKLRKGYSARWVTLYKTTPAAQCTASGGDATATDCTCPGNQPNTPASTIFVPGAGGCIANPGASESNCDASGGSWTDDEATLIGSFCACGLGRYDDDTGSCAAI
jgi:hypothetical protein